MDKKKNIKDLLKDIQNRKHPEVMQQVKPIFKSVNKDMVQCNFDIHPDLKKRLKLRALEEDRTIKEIITAAISAYLR